MKHIFILGAFFVLFACGTTTQKNKPQNTETVQVETVIESYFLDSLSENSDNQIGVKKLGTINSGEIVESSFYLKNNTSEPMVILDVNGSCGCLSFEYDKKPLNSGDTRKIVFTFDTKTKMGVQFSTVKIKTDKNDYVLKVESEIK